MLSVENFQLIQEINAFIYKLKETIFTLSVDSMESVSMKYPTAGNCMTHEPLIWDYKTHSIQTNFKYDIIYLNEHFFCVSEVHATSKAT